MCKILTMEIGLVILSTKAILLTNIPVNDGCKLETNIYSFYVFYQEMWVCQNNREISHAQEVNMCKCMSSRKKLEDKIPSVTMQIVQVHKIQPESSCRH